MCICARVEGEDMDGQRGSQAERGRWDRAMHQSHLGGLLKQIAASHLQFQSVWRRRCISTKFLGDTCPETTCREALG